MKPNKKAIEMSANELASYIDHSVLKPEFSIQEATDIINEGIKYNCKAVCVQGSMIDLALELTKGTNTIVAACIGFPQGVNTTAVKLFETEEYCKKGVPELDMVANFGWIRSGMYKEVEEEIRLIAEVCHKYGVILKVILETDALTKEEVEKATQCVINAKADFVKTSTGFITGVPSNGATIEMIETIQAIVKDQIKIKGSGGIRTREHFLNLVDMGIDRMGVGYKSTPLILEGSACSTDNNDTY